MSKPSQGKIRTPDVPVEFDGAPYTMRFSTRATMALMDLWKIEDQRELQAEMQKRGSTMRGMIEVIWASLQTHHRDLEVDDVLTLLDGTDLGATMEKVTEAISRAVPEAPKAPAA